ILVGSKRGPATTCRQTNRWSSAWKARSEVSHKADRRQLPLAPGHSPAFDRSRLANVSDRGLAALGAIPYGAVQGMAIPTAVVAASIEDWAVANELAILQQLGRFTG